MLRYEVINRLYFLKQLNEFDFKFRSLVFNRISYLEKEPLKYACVGVESLKLYTLNYVLFSVRVGVGVRRWNLASMSAIFVTGVGVG